jgi:hypothetical protein
MEYAARLPARESASAEAARLLVKTAWSGRRSSEIGAPIHTEFGGPVPPVPHYASSGPPLIPTEVSLWSTVYLAAQIPGRTVRISNWVGATVMDWSNVDAVSR